MITLAPYKYFFSGIRSDGRYEPVDIEAVDAEYTMMHKRVHWDLLLA